MEYNYKVVAKLKDDLSEEKKNAAMSRIDDLQRRLKIIKIDEVTYRKQGPIQQYDDFGAVTIFFIALEEDLKECFESLVYYNLWEDRKRVAV